MPPNEVNNCRVFLWEKRVSLLISWRFAFGIFHLIKTVIFFILSSKYWTNCPAKWHEHAQQGQIIHLARIKREETNSEREKFLPYLKELKIQFQRFSFISRESRWFFAKDLEEEEEDLWNILVFSCIVFLPGESFQETVSIESVVSCLILKQIISRI